MSRIRAFYERRFRQLAGASGENTGEAAKLLERAEALAKAKGTAVSLEYAMTLASLRRERGETANYPQRFVCDAGLGGLTRWLRGAGYEAEWNPDLDDPAVIRLAQQRGATLITTDSLMMQRGVLRDGLVPSVFVPSSITCEEQLVVVLQELGLSLRDSRCMHCGGELKGVAKTSVAERIPPRTALWIDDYFICARCGKLFWRGTHFRKIEETLKVCTVPRAG